MITAVSVPTAEQEAARDLVRARGDCRADLMRARRRLSKLLLQHGIVYSDGAAWTGKHDRWLRRDAFAGPTATRSAFDADYEAVFAVTARRDRLDAQIEQMAAASEFTAAGAQAGLPARGRHPDRVRARGRGRRLDRFTGASVGSFLGLVPSEHSSGQPRSQGPITKTGNSHARRLLVEAAWHHRARYLPGKSLQDRWDLAPTTARARGDAGNRRLHRRWVRFIDRKKQPTTANAAIARELAGWCWSLAVLDDAPTSTP